MVPFARETFLEIAVSSGNQTLLLNIVMEITKKKKNKSTFWKIGQTCWVRWHNHKSFLPQTTSATLKTKASFSYKFMEMSKCAFSLGRHRLWLGRIISQHRLYNQYKLWNNFRTGKSCNSSGIGFLCYNLWDNIFCWIKLASENQLLEAVQFL